MFGEHLTGHTLILLELAGEIGETIHAANFVFNCRFSLFIVCGLS